MKREFVSKMLSANTAWYRPRSRKKLRQHRNSEINNARFGLGRVNNFIIYDNRKNDNGRMSYIHIN